MKLIFTPIILNCSISLIPSTTNSITEKSMMYLTNFLFFLTSCHPLITLISLFIASFFVSLIIGMNVIIMIIITIVKNTRKIGRLNSPRVTLK